MHEVTEECMPWHCASCHEDHMAGPKLYVSCSECGHIYRSPSTLWWAQLREVWRCRKVWGGLKAYIPALIANVFQRARKIHTCPLCASDL